MTRHSRPIALAVTLAACAGIAAAASAGPHHPHHRKAAPFVAHEWGTFTTFQGSDGVSVAGLQHEVEHLPAFVHRRTVATASPFERFGDPSRDVPVRQVRSKMETPVIYFHSDRRRNVRVRVGFARGLMSHYYPAPTVMTPAPADGEQLNLSDIDSSTLEWELELIPRSEGTRVDVPALPADDHYARARGAKSAYVRARHGDRVEDEQFVFYRGLGHTAPAVSIAARRRGRATLTNASQHAVPMAFAVEMTADTGRFAPIGPVDAGASVDIALSGRLQPKAKVVARLGDAVHAALVRQGLYPDEARAMVETWSHQWFGDAGTRVLYIVPPAYVDSVLPLSISPAPEQLVRVFVGRLEYMTPEVERQVETALRDRNMSALAGFGRFLEPMVRSVRARTGNRAVRIAADDVLAGRTHSY